MSWQIYNAGYTDVRKDLQNGAKDLQNGAKAIQKGATPFARYAPVTGDIGDWYALLAGKDLYTGESMGGFDRWGVGVTAAILP